jgi:hypothetical protein
VPRAALPVALLWVLASLVVLAWPGVTIRVIALAVGSVLIIDGIAKIVMSLGAASVEARIASLFAGLASVIFGVLALGWPDVTLLIVAVIFGARMVWFGLCCCWDAVHWQHDVGQDVQSPQHSASRRLLRRWAAAVGGAAALALALLLTGASVRLHAAAPVADAFYAAPLTVPQQPGQLLSSEPFARNIQSNAQAWRVLYTTTRDEFKRASRRKRTGGGSDTSTAWTSACHRVGARHHWLRRRLRAIARA